MNADIRPIRTAAESGLIDAFEAARRTLPGGEAALVIREEALRLFAVAGLPNRRFEDWKYTDLRALMREARPLAKPATEVEIDAAKAMLPLGDIAALRIVFVNGRFAPALSDPLDGADGVTIMPLAKALAVDAAEALSVGHLAAENVAVALNTAFAAEGLTVAVAPGVALARPIHVANVQLGEAHASFGRVRVTVGQGASITLIESHSGDAGAHQTNTLISLDVADDAKASVIKLQDEGLGTLHLATLAARLGAKSELTSIALAAGSAAARQQIFVAFTGDRSTATLGGAGFAGARRHLDTTMVVDHGSVGCTSRETFKSVLDGHARSVFQGKIVVRPGAQKTDGKMMANALLLSEDAEADAKPELEIFADDVVCGHGATVGAIDDELLFYLKSRGIPQAEAEALLVEAFIAAAFEGVEDETLREALRARTEAWLKTRD